MHNYAQIKQLTIEITYPNKRNMTGMDNNNPIAMVAA